MYNPFADPVIPTPPPEDENEIRQIPIRGGSLIGNLNVNPPFRIVQCQLPIGSCDLTNKTYVDTFKRGSYLFRAIGSVFLNPSDTTRAFSTGNKLLGPDVWSDPYITCKMNPDGIVTIISSLQETIYFKLTYIACNLVDTVGGKGMVACSFYDETHKTTFGITKTLKCLPLSFFNMCNEAFTNEVHLVALKAILPGDHFEFSIKLVNIGPNKVTVDSTNSPNTSNLIVDRIV
jgi:hypothetical protein